MMESKVLRDAHVKVSGSSDNMTYEGIFSVFGNKDHAGDIVQPGAFAESLNRWKASGRPIPVYYAHRMDDPMMRIGKVIDAAEVYPGDPRLDGAKGAAATNGGLWAKVQLYPDDAVASKVWQGVKDETLVQSSFTYDIDAGHFESKIEDGEDDSFYSLDKLSLLELGPCPLGCNDQTDVLSAKVRKEWRGKVIDSDDNPSQLLAGLDATLDEATNLTANTPREDLPAEVAQALDLLVAAESQVDELMELMGVYDPDDAGESEKRRPGVSSKANAKTDESDDAHASSDEALSVDAAQLALAKARTELELL